LFFGKNFVSEDQVVIEPTRALLNRLERHGVRATLFTDVLCIKRYRELGLDTFPSSMDSQLRESIANGHDVQLHLHPHWITSLRIDDQWSFDLSHYRLHSLGFGKGESGEAGAEKVIRWGKAYLENLLRPIADEYRCIGFRAGGYCLQPEREMLAALKACEITIDSSVLSHCSADSDVHRYCYKGIPSSVEWWVNPKEGIDVAIDRPGAQHVLEVPIGAVHWRPALWKLKVNRKLSRRQARARSVPRGSYMAIQRVEPVLKSRFLARVRSFLNVPLVLSFDNDDFEILVQMVGEFLKAYDCVRQNHYVSIICHPKVLDVGSLDDIGRFLDDVLSRFQHVRFSTIRDVYNQECRARLGQSSAEQRLGQGVQEC